MATPGLEFGLDRPLVIREETIHPPANPCRVAYVSDIHLRRGRSALLSSQIIDALRQAHPDIILLGGDLVDQASELVALTGLLERMLTMAPVFAIPGNHDIAVGEDKVREAVEQTRARWIHGTTVSIRIHGRRVSLSGPGGEISPDTDVAILCAHNPSIWTRVKHAGYHLVLAGHLHGCQWVWFEAMGRLFPGAMFYPHNYLRRKNGNTRMFVSRGCSDLIPIRWGCPREVILCIL